MFNRRTLCVVEFVHVACDYINSVVQENALEDEDEDAGFQDKYTAHQDETKVKDLEQSKDIIATPLKDLPKKWRTQRDLSLDNIIGEISMGVSTCSRLRILCNNMAFVSQIEHRNINEALHDGIGCWLCMMDTISDAILPRKGPVTRAMSKRLHEDWARVDTEGLRVLMNLRVDF